MEDLMTPPAGWRDVPRLVDDSTRTDVILRALVEAQPFAGQTETLDLVMAFHPPVVVQALFVRLLRASGDMAYHCAATLSAIHGVDGAAQLAVSASFVSPS